MCKCMRCMMGMKCMMGIISFSFFFFSFSSFFFLVWTALGGV